MHVLSFLNAFGMCITKVAVYIRYKTISVLSAWRVPQVTGCYSCVCPAGDAYGDMCTFDATRLFVYVPCHHK